MNKSATSREELLELSVRLAEEKGFAALTIRDLATAAGVSVGCIYNYFPSKAALISATVEMVWQGIFHGSGAAGQNPGFPETVQWMFDRIKAGSARFPDFFAVHASGFSRGESEEGRQTMARYFGHIKGHLLRALKSDPRLRENAFDESLSAERLVDFVFDSLLALFIRRSADCGTLLAVIRKAVF